MLTLIKNIHIYAPENLGKKDVLISGGTIIAIDDYIEPYVPYTKVIDGKNKIAVPGFVDSLVHITGGGGEGGFTTRTPEIDLTDLTRAGITTLVAALGTDSVTRSLAGLIAKAKELKRHGLNCYIYTGSYHLPVKTLTGDIQNDIVFLEECIGVGEVAISDHRGSQSDYRQIASLAANARVGGMLSGKSGIVSIHMGDGPTMFEPLYEVINNTEIPIKQFYPTHINRNQKLLDAGIEFCKKGGFIDLTTSRSLVAPDYNEIKCSSALKYFLENKGEIEQITFSSDGHASLPQFDTMGQLTSLELGSEMSLFNEVRDAVLIENIPLETALRPITSSPADILKLSGKGRIKIMGDADINLIEEKDLTLNTVICGGKIMLENGQAVVKGVFEK